VERIVTQKLAGKNYKFDYLGNINIRRFPEMNVYLLQRQLGLLLRLIAYVGPKNRRNSFYGLSCSLEV
jgi:hypothetical protein